RMKRELDPGIGGPLADFVEMLREDLAVRRAEILRADAFAEIHLEMRAAEMRDVLRAGGVAVDRLLKLRRVEILAAAADRAERDASIVEQFLEHVGRLLEVLRHVVLERFQAVVAVARGHLDAGFRMRRRGAELMPAHRVAHLVSGQRVRASRERRAETRTKEFASSQHVSSSCAEPLTTLVTAVRDPFTAVIFNHEAADRR